MLEVELIPSSGDVAWMMAAMLLAQSSLSLFRIDRRVLRVSHIALGIVLLPLTFAHAWFSMRMVPARFAGAIGIRLATAALMLLFVQLVLGVVLISPPENQRLARAVHVAVGLGIVFLASVHVLLARE